MLKILAALSILQTLAIGFLAARAAEINDRLALAEAAISVAEAAPSRAASQPATAPANAEIPVAANAALDAQMLRRLLREEFAALRLSPQAGASAPAPTAAIPADPQKTAAIRKDFNRLLTLPRVETRDLDHFVELAAQLPEAERARALRDLSRAINDGRIDGHF
ncbi:MAG: hypothetical protein AB7F91_05990 [Parvularculaceae bacterium]|nr:hypothetical protein [Parvularculaceae bacterium]